RGAVELLRALLDDPVADVALVAARSLVALGETPAAEPRWAPHLALTGCWDGCLALGRAGVAALLFALAEPDGALRAGAAAALGRSEALPPAAVDGLLAALADPVAPVRAAAARALGQQNVLGALPPLLERLADDDAAVGEAAVEALGQLGRKASAGLVQALGHDRAAVRRGAALALGRSGDKQAITALRQALGDDEISVRLAGVAALLQLGGKRPVRPLLEVLEGDAAAAVRAAAARALGRLGDAAVQTGLLAGMGDSYAEVRAACSEALEALGLPPSEEQRTVSRAIAEESWTAAIALGEAAVELLLRVAGEREADPRAVRSRCGALAALGEIGDGRAEPVVLAALGDGNPRVQAAAALALGRFGQAGVRPALLPLADHGDATVRAAAVEALGKLGVAAALEQLTRALEDADERVRAAAAAALGMAGETTLEQLLAALRSPDAAVRQAAAEALGQSGNRQAIDPLCEVLGDQVNGVRLAATRALVQLGWQPVGWRVLRRDRGYAFWTTRSFWIGTDPERDQLALLLDALRHADADRRRNAAEALGLLGDAAALQPLLAALADADADVRFAAAQALLELGATPQAELCWAPCFVLRGEWAALVGLGEATIPLLADVLREEQVERRLAAVRALAEIGGPQATGPLSRALGDPASHVAALAAQELGKLGDARAIPALISRLADGAAACPQEVGTALSSLRPEAVGELARLLAEGATLAQCRAAEVLGGCPEAEAGDALRAALGSTAAATREAAARALGRRGDPAALVQLGEALLGDLEARVRLAAAEALAALGGAGAAELLRIALADSFAEVRRAALAGLEALGQPADDRLLQAVQAIGEERWDRCADLGETAQ
ncbi:MAG: HEAT repeat domain-containing protein, partial [Deltaproteobacteria bacterium]|nr:HEAT repeat domain-containing protein [Deltaproteobacteria bacterium]